MLKIQRQSRVFSIGASRNSSTIETSQSARFTCISHAASRIEKLFTHQKLAHGAVCEPGGSDAGESCEPGTWINATEKNHIRCVASISMKGSCSPV
ncbi:MAG: hypothetical protein ACREOO_11580 [bacterium]